MGMTALECKVRLSITSFGMGAVTWTGVVHV